jgi:hypothetical protein
MKEGLNMAEPTTPATDLADKDLLRTPHVPDDRNSPPQLTKWIVVAAFVVAGAIVLYIAVVNRRAAAPQAPTTSRNATGSGQTDRPLGGEAAAINLPPLDQTDQLVRDLVNQLSSHPSVVAWLMSDRLIRNFAVVVSNTAEGPTPAVHLRPLRPTGSFKVTERGGRLVIDSRSYDRYNAVAAAAASIDPAGASKVYATLKPRIEDAYRDLGTGTTFDRALEQAIVALLKTPVVADPIIVRPEGGVGYAFVDPALENLTPAQKHLLRTGSANVRTIQAWLRSVALALGIPAERLPKA